MIALSSCVIHMTWRHKSFCCCLISSSIWCVGVGEDHPLLTPFKPHFFLNLTIYIYANVAYQSITNLITLCHEVIMSCAMCIVVPLKEAITSYMFYRNRPNDIQGGLQWPLCLPNSLQRYFTAKCDFFMLRVRFKVGFYSLKYQLTQYCIIVISSKNKLVGCPLGAPISYYLKLQHLFQTSC